MENIKNFLVSTVEGRNLDIDALPDDILLDADFDVTMGAVYSFY